MKISETMLPEFDQEMANTRKVLERVPADKSCLQTTPQIVRHSARLAAHIANMADWAKLTMESDSFDYAPPGAPPYRNANIRLQRSSLLAAFDKGVAEGTRGPGAADDGKLLAPWTLMAGGKTIMTMPRVAVIRSFVMNHIIHHRAQLGVYLRLNDIPVPGDVRSNRG